MKKLIGILSLTCIISHTTVAQKARDILEDGITVGKSSKLFIVADNTDFKIANGKGPENPLTFPDSTIFLVKNTGVNVYLAPLNPLNYSYKTEKQLVLGQVDEDLAKAYDDFMGLFQMISIPNGNLNAGQKAYTLGLQRTTSKDGKALEFCEIKSLINEAEAINDSLRIDQKTAVNVLFSKLKTLSFSDENTINDLKELADEKKLINEHYTRIEKAINTLTTSIKSYQCKNEEYAFIVKRVFTDYANDLTRIYNEQMKRVGNINNIFDMVDKAAQKALAKKDGLSWCYKLEEVAAPKGGTMQYAVTINESGYSLADGEITTSETKLKYKRTLRVRRYSAFVPEVSAGIAYTGLHFPKYGLQTGEDGQQRVAEAGTDEIKKYNLTTMLNWVLFCKDSPVNPFLQTGVGINADFPALFLGGGLRLNFIGKGRIALASGIATSWVKTLNSLEVGDIVSGSAELEDDLKYELASPKLYFGIQYNF